MCWRSRILRAGGENLVLNCGYGHGYSVSEVVDVVKDVSGVDFETRRVGRRAGDPAALVAGADRVRAKLGWVPRHDNLREIVTQAYEWERKLRDGTVPKARAHNSISTDPAAADPAAFVSVSVFPTSFCKHGGAPFRRCSPRWRP